MITKQEVRSFLEYPAATCLIDIGDGHYVIIRRFHVTLPYERIAYFAFDEKGKLFLGSSDGRTHIFSSPTIKAIIDRLWRFTDPDTCKCITASYGDIVKNATAALQNDRPGMKYYPRRKAA